MMKKMNIKLFFRSLFSFTVAVFFVVLFSGSLSLLFLNDETKVLENGDYQKTLHLSEDETILKTGPQDYYGRWHGPVEITHVEDYGRLVFFVTEEVNMVRGKKHGKAKISRNMIGGSPTESFVCYNMGKVVDCEKSAVVSVENPSAFEVLTDNFPAYVLALNTFGFDSSYIKSYTDTVEAVLREYEFEPEEFDVYYEEALDEIDETPYDSIIALNLTMTLIQTFEEIKNSDFRLAVIDGYNDGEVNTYNSVQSGYGNYLVSLNDSGITNNDFEIFCYVFDSLMMSYGALDTEDPFFIDSLDTRMFRAMDYISSDESGSESSLLALKSAGISRQQLSWKNLRGILNYALKSVFVESSPKDVSEFILLSMLHHYINSDVIRQAVHEAHLIENNIVRLPEVTTQLSETTTGNQVMVSGTVIEDGGAEIAARGIVWGESYNPTTDDKVKNAGTGTGDFSGLITGLEAGITYFARAFATNSAGTAYGNNIRIVASSATGLTETDFFELNVFPNPATDFVTIQFNYKANYNFVLSIVDLNGKVVFSEILGTQNLKQNTIKLDVSEFKNGLYYCHLTNGEIQISRKLVVAH